MELEEMKTSWEVLSKQVANQEHLTPEMIANMTTQNYRSKLNQISKWEITGTVFCFAAAVYLVVSFPKITLFYLQIFAGICIAILFILPIISLTLLRGMSQLNMAEKSYAETIASYARHKIKFQRFQQSSVLFTVILMIIGMPVMMAILGKDLGKVHYYWSAIFPVMLLLFSIFAWRVLKYYNRSLKKAEAILSDLNR